MSLRGIPSDMELQVLAFSSECRGHAGLQLLTAAQTLLQRLSRLGGILNFYERARRDYVGAFEQYALIWSGYVQTSAALLRRLRGRAPCTETRSGPCHPVGRSSLR